MDAEKACDIQLEIKKNFINLVKNTCQETY